MKENNCINCGLPVTSKKSNLCKSCGQGAVEAWNEKDEVTPAERMLDIVRFLCEKEICSICELKEYTGLKKSALYRHISIIAKYFDIEKQTTHDGTVQYIIHKSSLSKYFNLKNLQP